MKGTFQQSILPYPEKVAFYKEQFQTMTAKDMAEYYNVHPRSINTLCSKLGLKKTKEQRSAIVASGWNKKKGGKRFLHTKGTIVYRKNDAGKSIGWILNGVKWQTLHSYNWQQAGRELPKGSVLSFKDGNAENQSLDNLELKTRAQTAIDMYVKKTGKLPSDIAKKRKEGREERKKARLEAKALKIIEKEQRKKEKAERSAANQIEYRKNYRNKLKQITAQKREERQKMQAITIQRAKASKRDGAVEKQWQANREKSKKRLPVFESKPLDLSQKIKVYIPQKRMIVYMNPGEDREAIIKKYLKTA
jgi:hypothetical protein